MYTNFKNLIFFSIALLLSPASVFCNQPKSNSYRAIGNSLISSYGVVEQEQPIATEQEKVKLDITPLTEQQARQLAFSLFDSFGSFGPSDAIEAGNVLTDLETFWSSNKKDHSSHIFKAIDCTETTFGQAALAKMLATPTMNVSTLEKRQALIQRLLADEALFNQIDALLQNVKNAESTIFSFWNDENKVTKDQLNKLYFSKRFIKELNTKPWAMEAYVRLGNVSTTAKITSDIILLTALNYVAHKKRWLPILQPISVKEAFTGTLKHIGNLYNPLSIYTDAKDAYTGKTVAGIKEMYAKAGHAIPESQTSAMQKGVYAGIAINNAMKIGYVWSRYSAIKDALSQANQDKNGANYLQAKLIGVAVLVNSLKALSEMPELQEGLILGNNIHQLFDPKSAKSVDFKQLIGLLQTNTFSGDPSFFSLTGRVLAANELMKRTKDEMVSGMEALGEVDACLSIAKLYKQFQNTNSHYGFAEYVKDAQKPYICLQNFWNPLVAQNKVVTNSLTLGNPIGHIVLTGSNTGGKSTMLKAIMLNVLMAHTLTICPADQVIVTPMSWLESCLNIVDDTAHGDSLHQAEINRAVQLMHTAHKLAEKSALGFCVIDELFRGTGPEQADLETYDCVKDIIGVQELLSITATHYARTSTQLEKQTGLCKNYKIEAWEDENGTIIRPFKLEEGISQHNISAALLQQAKEQLNNK